MKKYQAAALLAMFLPSALQGQGFWVNKEFRQWSARECSRLLHDSPWCKMQTFTTVSMQELSQRSEVPGRDNAPQMSYLIQLWSALPVRQAAVRLVELSPEYLRLSTERRRERDVELGGLMAADFEDRIVFRVEYFTTAHAYDRDLAMYWQDQPEASWKQRIYLNTESGRRSLLAVHMAPGSGGSFELVFPRILNGAPVIRTMDKSFTVDFDVPNIGAIRGGRVLAEFKLKEMMVKGAPVF